jgi:hypothetical protein
MLLKVREKMSHERVNFGNANAGSISEAKIFEQLSG